MTAKPQPPEKKEAQSEPEQKLGDTPVAPWQMPKPEEKAEARPVRRALKEALAEVDSPEKAEEVVREIEAATEGQTVADKVPKPASAAQAAQAVQQTAQAAPPGETTKQVLAETARAVLATEGREREAVAQAAQEVLNPEQQGAPTANAQEREYLRQAVLKRMKPLEALDAGLFLQVNHLPHTHALNGFFYFITFIFTGGVAWLGLMGLVMFLKRRLGWRIVRTSALPLTIATALVEYPIKAYFRRRRPFITIIQAIVIGKKPGTWSFPSGHSASAFAGAVLMGRHFPRLKPLWYLVASLVAFSRVYLGDHYPGDVTSGSLLGATFATLFRWLLRPRR